MPLSVNLAESRQYQGEFCFYLFWWWTRGCESQDFVVFFHLPVTQYSALSSFPLHYLIAIGCFFLPFSFVFSPELCFCCCLFFNVFRLYFMVIDRQTQTGGVSNGTYGGFLQPRLQELGLPLASKRYRQGRAGRDETRCCSLRRFWLHSHLCHPCTHFWASVQHPASPRSLRVVSSDALGHTEPHSPDVK